MKRLRNTKGKGVKPGKCPCKLLMLSFLLLPFFSAFAQQNATIHHNDGLIETVKIHSANSSGVMWSDRKNPKPQLMPHDQIAMVDFPETNQWKQGNDYFNKGDFAKAIAAFSSLANDPRGNFHPTPGNFTSRARLRLIECYRETGNTGAIVKVAASLDEKALPKAERNRSAVALAWAELGKENWEGALAKAESISADPIKPDRNDLGFIKAVALENTGKPEEAIIAYGTAYTVDFGASRELAKRALKNAILLLLELNRESREDELQSLVHTYAKVYNKGKLWGEAPAKLTELLEKKVEMPQKPEVTEAKAEEDPAITEEKPQGPKPVAKPSPKPEAKPAPKPAPKPLTAAQKRQQRAKARSDAKAKADAKTKAAAKAKGAEPENQPKEQ